VHEPLLARAEARGDRWRITAARLVDALLATELDPPLERDASVRAFLTAFREVPHDDSFSLHGFARLAERLETRGAPELAGEVREALAARRAQHARGFAR
jgi:hypothetical protein